MASEEWIDPSDGGSGGASRVAVLALPPVGLLSCPCRPFPPADLLWDISGAGNCWAGNTYATAFPSLLPACVE
jgi:hypothetical protein